jgi:hypothetical protein
LKYITKEGVLLLKAYRIDELEKFPQAVAIKKLSEFQPLIKSYYTEEQIIQLSNLNEYLYTKKGEHIPLIYTVGPSGSICAMNLKVAGEQIPVKIQSKF